MAALDGVSDGDQQFVVAERLGQEFHRSSLHSLDCRRNVAMPCYENDLHIDAVGYAPLQLKAVQVRQRHVEDETAWRDGPRPSKECPRGSKNFGVPTRAAIKLVQQLPHRDVIVDHKYDWNGCWHRR